MTDAAGSESWAHDKMGREIAEQRTTNGVTKSTTYSYNLDGSLATLTYPSGRIITYPRHWLSLRVSRASPKIDGTKSICSIGFDPMIPESKTWG